MHFWTGPAYAAPPAPPAPLTEEEADHILRRLGLANLVERDQHDDGGHRYTLINGHVLTIAPNGALAFADAEGARDAVRAALRALERGIVAARIPAVVGATRIRDVTDDSDQELYEDEVRQPRRLLEVTIRYEE